MEEIIKMLKEMCKDMKSLKKSMKEFNVRLIVFGKELQKVNAVLVEMNGGLVTHEVMDDTPDGGMVKEVKYKLKREDYGSSSCKICM